MTTLNVLFDSADSDRVNKIKAPIGGVRKVFAVGEYDKAKAAFDSAVAAAGGAIPSFAMDAEAFAKQTATVGEGDDSTTVEYEMRPTVAVIGARVRNASNKMETGIRGIVMFAIPEASAFISLASPWVGKIIDKEAAHVAFRGLRLSETVEELEAAFAKVPNTVESFVAESTSSGLDTTAYDTIHPEYKKWLQENHPKFAALLPAKGELLKGLRSAAYARDSDDLSKLEAGGFIAIIGKQMIDMGSLFTDKDGTPTPVDTSVIEEWLAERATTVLAAPRVQEKNWSDLDSISFATGDEEEEQQGDGE